VKPLELSRQALAQVFAHARETAPDECCGVIVSQGGHDEVWRMRNVQDELHARDPVTYPRTARTAYALGREDIERLDRAAPKVIYHSHTKNGAYFSGEDRARAMFMDEPTYPEVTYLVVSDARAEGEVKGFRWSDAERDFVEVAIELD